MLPLSPLLSCNRIHSPSSAYRLVAACSRKWFHFVRKDAYQPHWKRLQSIAHQKKMPSISEAETRTTQNRREKHQLFICWCVRYIVLNSINFNVTRGQRKKKHSFVKCVEKCLAFTELHGNGSTIDWFVVRSHSGKGVFIMIIYVLSPLDMLESFRPERAGLLWRTTRKWQQMQYAKAICEFEWIVWQTVNKLINC